MKIEEAIKQKRPFRNAWHKATVNLLYTSNWVSDHIKEFLRPSGITMQQYNVLRVLRGAGEPISTSTIRERLLDRMSDTSRMVDRLYQKGLVNRRICPNDKRLVDVSLSENGYRLLESLDQNDSNFDALTCGNLTEQEAVLLNELLDKIRNGKS
jgi:DNA-binding MarR family transcriptional regulator